MKLFFCLLVVFGLLVGLAMPAFAIANPDIIGIYRVMVFRNLAETGDQLFFLEYIVGYNITPEETPGEAFKMAIYSADGATMLYQRELNYYGHNIMSIYLTQAEALTWGSAYQLKVMGDPSLFVPVEGNNTVTRALGAGNYKENTELDNNMLFIAGELQTAWGITLLTASGLLNDVGKTYFEKAIPNLSQYIPWIFSTYITYPTLGNTTGNLSYSNVTEGHAGPNLTAGVADLANWWGISARWMGFALTGLSALVVASISYSIFKKPEPGYIFGIMTIFASVWVGLLDPRALLVFVVFLAVIFGVRVILREFA